MRARPSISSIHNDEEGVESEEEQHLVAAVEGQEDEVTVAETEEQVAAGHEGAIKFI